MRWAVFKQDVLYRPKAVFSLLLNETSERERDVRIKRRRSIDRLSKPSVRRQQTQGDAHELVDSVSTDCKDVRMSDVFALAWILQLSNATIF